MPEIPPSLLDRFLRSDATMYAETGELPRDTVDEDVCSPRAAGFAIGGALL